MEAEDLRTQLQTTNERLTRTVGIADGLFFERVANRDRIEVLEDFATALTHRNEFAMMAMRESIDASRPMSTRVCPGARLGHFGRKLGETPGPPDTGEGEGGKGKRGVYYILGECFW